MVDVAVLLSVGRHPASGRPRRADLDARALDLALRLPQARVRALHAGDPDEPALRDYLGMGLAAIDVLAIGTADDPLPALVDHLRSAPPDLVLTGVVAEAGEGSGALPYALAASLDLTVAANVAAIDIVGSEASIVQALPRGRRRALGATLPVFATVGVGAPPARQSAFARARVGAVWELPATSVLDRDLATWQAAPARPRPPRLKPIGGATAAERLRLATDNVGTGGRVLEGLPPDRAAAEIYRYLKALGLVGGPDSTTGKPADAM